MSMRVDTPPPALETGDSGGGSEWIPLVTVRGDIDAHLIEGRLLVAGIEVRAIKDRTGPTWLLGGSDPWGPVAIWVKRFQYDDSRIVLAEVSFAAAGDGDARDAPGSHDGRGARNEETMKGWSPFVWWAVAIALGLGFTGIGLARSADYIDRCGFSASCEESP
jgi:hypothetical protein